MKINEFLLMVKQFKDEPKQITDKTEIAHWTDGDWIDYYYVFDLGPNYRFEVVDGPKHLYFGLFYCTPGDTYTTDNKKKFYHCLFQDKCDRMDRFQLMTLLKEVGITLDNPDMIVNLNVKEKRDLLYVDMCARLPFDLKAEITSIFDESKSTQNICACKTADIADVIYLNFGDGGFYPYEISNFKILLRSMSDMTFEEKDEFMRLSDKVMADYAQCIKDGVDVIKRKSELTFRQTEWLLKKHFDFRGLIKAGLAKEYSVHNLKNIK